MAECEGYVKQVNNKNVPNGGVQVTGEGKNIMIHSKLLGIYDKNDKLFTKRNGYKIYGAFHPTDEVDDKKTFKQKDNKDGSNCIG